jgi:hypothetical protein
VLVRVQGLGVGGGGGAEPAELRLSGTAAAIARYRQQVPPGSGGAAPESPGLDGRELLGRVMRFLGL